MTCRTGLIGAGGVGRKRAAAVQANPQSVLTAIYDLDERAASSLAAETGAQTTASWREIVDDADIDAVIVSTPHDALADISCAALKAGKHVLCEKPVGRNPPEVRSVAEAAAASQGRLRAGYNHRFHPAVARVREALVSGELGELVFIRGRYGHGGRPGYEKEWRGDAERAGGGELLDQGAHLVDLSLWLLDGDLASVTGHTTTQVWPIEPLEDNAFGLFRTSSGQVVSLHVSWTQWRNLFSLEVFGHEGFAIAEGLGGSYGTERLRLGRRRSGRAREEEDVTTFDGEDVSWSMEWAAALRDFETGSVTSATADDALATIEWIYRLYRASKEGRLVTSDDSP